MCCVWSRRAHFVRVEGVRCACMPAGGHSPSGRDRPVHAGIWLCHPPLSVPARRSHPPPAPSAWDSHSLLQPPGRCSMWFMWQRWFVAQSQGMRGVHMVTVPAPKAAGAVQCYRLGFWSAEHPTTRHGVAWTAAQPTGSLGGQSHAPAEAAGEASEGREPHASQPQLRQGWHRQQRAGQLLQTHQHARAGQPGHCVVCIGTSSR